MKSLEIKNIKLDTPLCRQSGLTAEEAAGLVRGVRKHWGWKMKADLTKRAWPSILKSAKDYLTRNPEHTMLKILLTLIATMMASLRLATNPLQTKIRATLAGLRATKAVKKGAKVAKPKPKPEPKQSKKEQAQWAAEWPKQYSALYHQWVESWLISARDRDRLLFVLSGGALALLFSFLSVSVHNDPEASFEIWQWAVYIFTATLIWSIAAPHFDKAFIGICLLGKTPVRTPEAMGRIWKSAGLIYFDNFINYVSIFFGLLAIPGIVLLVMLATARTGF